MAEMNKDKKDWNYDCIHLAQAQIADCQNDMMICLYRGEVSGIVKDRMCKRLRSAADDLERLFVRLEENK